MRKNFKVLKPKPGSHMYDLTGVNFGYLTVVGFHSLDKYKNKLWECRCECGNICFYTTTTLNSGKRVSCGCSKYKTGDKVYNYKGFGEITGSKWNSIINNAKTRKLEFSITKEFVTNVLNEQNNKCYFSDIEISFRNKTASVDRLDSGLGYNDDNVVIVHKDINRMKTNFSVDYFKFLCKMVCENKNLK